MSDLDNPKLHFAKTQRGVDLKVLVDDDGKVVYRLCCLCAQYIRLEDLYVDESGDKWDVCRECQDKVSPREGTHE